MARKRKSWKSKKQAWFLAKDGLPISQVRAIAKAQGRLCLHCLSRPRIIATRCKECADRRKEENKGRKR